MSATPEGTTPSGSSLGERTYIRAGGGVQLKPLRVAAVLVWLLVALLAGLAIYFAVTGAQQNSQLNSLRDRGVPVTATVTGCRGISSGVGMGIEYWECRGSYTLGVGAFDAVINGSRSLLERGTQVQAIAVPGRPDLLSTASSVRAAKGSGTQYGAAIGLGAGAVAAAGSWLWVRRLKRRGGSDASS
jgi:hypothetical protein